MTIQTVIDNLNQTIEGKEQLQKQLAAHCHPFDDMVRVNISELIRIRDDLIKVRDGS